MFLPEPSASRFLRLPSMISGFWRSFGVMLRMIASTGLKESSSISSPFNALPIPGIMPIKSLIFPIFFTCSSWERKSSKLKLFWRIFALRRLASSSSKDCCARSTREITSPMPNIRWAIRSGWNTSKFSIFSPVEINLIGLFTTWRMEMAAPPRVSPSNLVNTTPSKLSRSSKVFAVFTASWPVMESTTKSVSDGLSAFLSCSISCIIASSTAKRPAVSTTTVFLPVFLA